MELLRPFLLVTVGGGIAFLAGGLGIGGGVLAVPVLYYFGEAGTLPTEHTAHVAVAASLVMAMFLSASATLSYFKQGRVQWRPAVYLILGSITGAFLAARTAASFSSPSLAGLFGILLLLNGLISLLRPRSGRSPLEVSQVESASTAGTSKGTSDETFTEPQVAASNSMSYRRRLVLIVSGLGVGVASGLTGIGGGVLMVPLYSRFFGMTVKEAIATSSFCIVFTTLAGVLGFVSSPTLVSLPGPHLGLIYLPYAVPLSMGALIGGYAGAFVSGKLQSRTLVAAFGVVQVLVGGKLLWDTWLSALLGW